MTCASTTPGAARCGRGSTPPQIFAGGSLDIRPGDLVLIDHSGTGEADHIVMAHSYDMTTNTLMTIGGNDGGYEVDTSPAHAAPKGESQATREKRERMEAASGQPLRAPTSGHGVGVSSYDLDDSPDPVTLKGKTRVRIYGIGRPSIVDFEDHRYDSTSAKHPPNARLARRRGPRGPCARARAR